MNNLGRLLILLAPLPLLAADSGRTFEIWEPGLPSVYMSVSEEISVGIFQQGTGKPYATFLDQDGDGVFDLLTYDVLDVDGNLLRSIEDYGMDGQSDLKIDFTNDTVSVFYKGRWRKAEGEGHSRYVQIESKAVPLQEIVRELQKQ